MKNIFLVQQIGWDYDDNYYFRNGGSSPHKSYSSIELAEIAMKELNIKEFLYLLQQDSIQDYLGSESCFEDFKESLTNLFKDHPNISKLSDDWDSFYDLLDNEDYVLSEKQISEMQELFDLNFYEIVEVEFIHELS